MAVTLLNPREFTVTTTGAIDNLDFANAAIIRMNNASLSTLRGLKAGIAGQEVTVYSVGAGEVDLAHQNTSSTAANRFINTVTSGITPLAPGVGTATFRYDATATRWRLIQHTQGAPLAYTPTFSGFGSMTFTSVTANILYELRGNRVFLTWYGMAGTLGGTPSNQALFTLPNGYIGSASPLSAQLAFALLNNASGGNFQGFVQVAQGANAAAFVRNDSGAFTAGTLSAFGQADFFVS